jgi:hypothetical protein
MQKDNFPNPLSNEKKKNNNNNNEPNGVNKEAVDDDNNHDHDEEEFVFTDHVHQVQEFERFSASLANLGILDKDLVQTVIDDLHHPLPGDGSATSHDVAATPTIATATNTVLPTSASTFITTPRRASKLMAYREGQKQSFLAVLNQVDAIQAQHAQKGLSNGKFTFGLMNCLLIAYVFGSHPEQFWILYLIETIFWMTWKFQRMYHAKPLCEILYYLDFCWVMNVLGVVWLMLFVALANNNNNIDDDDDSSKRTKIEIRKQLFLSAFGIACGPVFLAAMALPFVAFLFHDVNTMANLVIHTMVPIYVRKPNKTKWKRFA